MNVDLTGKTALVCGSTQGIGLATAIELSLLGARIILMARNENSLKSALKKLALINQKDAHSYLVADFFDPTAVKSAVDTFTESGQVAEILVNNTGGPPVGELAKEPAEKFIQYFQAHIINNQTLVQALLPEMKTAQFGRIVNIISTSVKQPIPGLGVSNTIRGAVANWAKTLSIELGPFGITVNNVLPGYTQTARLESVISLRTAETGLPKEESARQMAKEIPIGRFLEPGEIGAAVAFLCTPAAAGINGINLPVDGGRTASL